ncbi:hypothetical protein FE257_009858 [Aspergillus nanangensis]|uniref:Carrier domain-containing protein n=1 Tax=Aspergillus nanangensis TaxID=2582783 RepID=A0AAD4CVX0_ASPNN|nr:hypothetical protein FE257_009858 [Aspergillus nanangensis]
MGDFQVPRDLPDEDAIAIVGMACRLPGMLDSPTRLWELCSQKRSAWSKMSDSPRFNPQAWYHPTPGRTGSFYMQGGHFLEEDVGLFDAPFFNITAKEAQSMDPQQRLLLECTYEALESAGLPKAPLAGRRVGVFVGGAASEYEINNMRDPENIPMFQATGCAGSLQANRISYYFDFKGPSVTLDTACSSSLSALHLACQSIKSGESEIAVVAGCHLNLLPDRSLSMSLSRLFSDTGRTYSFDHRATSGFGRGEGCACIVLKPLDLSVCGNDAVRALVVGTGVNQDGRTNGITVPSEAQQKELIEEVYTRAGISPMETGYVEAHGTGTKTGDPIEAAALHAAFGKGRTAESPLYIGSIKSNIGHTEYASGIVSVIKSAMILENGFILPSCNFEKANPAIPMDKWHMKVPTELVPWPEDKRYISINNFGFGGSNAHAVLMKVPNLKAHSMSSHAAVKTQKANCNGTASVRRLFPISLNDDKSLGHQLKALELFMHLKQERDQLDSSFMANLAYTLGQRRSVLPWKTAITAGSATELIEQLSLSRVKSRRSPEKPIIGFVFTGQGAQWQSMGRELLNRYPVFADSMRAADETVKRLDVIENNSTISLTDPCYSQTSCTAIQLALTNLLASWGVIPTAVTGHSSGEIGAAFATGALDFDTCIKIAYLRGRVVKSLTTGPEPQLGAMLAVGIGQKEAEELICHVQGGKVVVACVNSPSSITISGDIKAIEEFQSLADKQEVFNRKIKVDVAYHSHHMRLVSGHYKSLLGPIQPRSSNIEFFSSLLGAKMDTANLNADYWVENLASCVKFADSLGCLLQEATPTNGKLPNFLIEIGPHSALESPIKQIIQQRCGGRTVDYVSCLRRKNDGVQTMQQLAAFVFVNGMNLDFEKINFPEGEERSQVVLLTDLPKYQWDHSVKYWHSSRWASSHCNRPFGKNDILGALSMDSDSLEPRWRNVVRADDHPWIRQHQVQGKSVYPMSGYVSMAIEAISQLAILHNFPADNISFREVSVGKALLIPNTAAVEMTITLRPFAESTRASSDHWFEFRVFSWAEGKEWSEHCRGMVSAEADKKLNPVDGAYRLESNTLELQARIKSMELECTSPVDSHEMYDTVALGGVNYGPLFRGLKDVFTSPRCAIATLIAPDTASLMPNKYETGRFWHPVTLDICNQVVWPLLGYQSPGRKQLYLPTFVRRVHTNRNSTAKAGDTMKIFVSRTSAPSRRGPVGFDILVTSANDTTDVVLRLDGLHVTPVGDEDASFGGPVKELCCKIKEVPYFDLLKGNGFKLLQTIGAPSPNELQQLGLLEQVSVHFLEQALRNVDAKEHPPLKPYHQKFLAWAKEHSEEARRKARSLPDPAWLSYGDKEWAELISKVRETDIAGEMICRVGQQITEALHQEVEPLAIMLEDDLLERYYREFNSFCRSYSAAITYVDQIADQNPHLRILEIGAGTGGCSLPILECLGGGPTGRLARFSEYTYTDISSGFFENAKKKFSEWGDLLNYRTLDVSENPLSQGYDTNSYDLIIACNVLHATPRLGVTVENTRKLLKPGGKLLLVEETANHPRQFIYSLLPGWWMSEDNRQGGPVLSKKSWDVLLRDKGFSGIDIALDDYPGTPDQCSSLILTSAVGQSGLKGREVAIICPDKFEGFPVDSLAQNIEALTGCSVEAGTLGQVNCNEKICIFLGELNGPLLGDMNPDLFASVQSLLQEVSGGLWVHRPNSSRAPESYLVTGLARSVRSETSLPLATLDLDQNALFDDSTITHIVEVFKNVFDNPSGSTSMDMEYVVRDGVVHVTRLIHDDELNEYVHQSAGRCAPESQPVRQDNRPLKMVIQQPGALDTMYFTDDHKFETMLPKDQVEIQVECVGLNFKDIMITMGQIHNDLIGNECSGIVTAVGADVEGLSPGDRVCAVCEGAFATHVRSSAASVHKIPDTMSLAVGSTIPIVFCTAYYSLFDIGRLCEGEKVLIHAASGGVGQAAIILAQHIGAEIYATVGSPEKKSFLIERYGIHESNIFFSRDTSFAEGILNATNGEGVDVILNSFSGDMLCASWDCIAPFGRFVEIGKRDILQNSRLDMAQFDRNISFSSVDLTVVIKRRPALIKRLFADVFQLFEKGTAYPISPIASFPVSQVETVFRALQSGKVMGKAVIEMKQDALVKVSLFPPVQMIPIDSFKVLPVHRPERLLQEDATYLLVGGTGGLGRNIAEWLGRRGAKNLVLLSRTGGVDRKIKGLVNRLAHDGVKVIIYRCDISSKKDVDEAIQQTIQQMPPLRGIIFGAMVLKDSLFERTNHDDYTSIITPRVRGLWNLHNATLQNELHLDFFINLSSVAGVVGNRGQSIYAATSTFMSAFSRYRAEAGLPCCTIDLGPVKDIGYLAEHIDTQHVFQDLASQGLDEAELHGLLAGAISGKMKNTCDGHSITGLSFKDVSNTQPFFANDARFSHLLRAAEADQSDMRIVADSASTNQTIPLATVVRRCGDRESVERTVRDAIAVKVATVLMLPLEDIDPSRSIASYGLDSLVAIEVRNWIFRELAAHLQILEIIGAESLASLAKVTVEKSEMLKHLS